MVTDALMACPLCGAALPGPDLGGAWQGACPGCGVETRLEAFPRALDGPPAGSRGELRTLDEQAACFEHEDRIAEAACEACGRFLCAMCRVDLAGKSYCTACLEREADAGAMPALVKSYERYELNALVLFMFPVVVLLGVAILFGLTVGDVGGAIYAGFGIAIPLALFAWPLAFYLMYRSTKPQTGAPGSQRRTIIGLVILAALLIIVAGLTFIGVLAMIATQADEVMNDSIEKVETNAPST